MYIIIIIIIKAFVALHRVVLRSVYALAWLVFQLPPGKIVAGSYKLVICCNFMSRVELSDFWNLCG